MGFDLVGITIIVIVTKYIFYAYFLYSFYCIQAQHATSGSHILENIAIALPPGQRIKHGHPLPALAKLHGAETVATLGILSLGAVPAIKTAPAPGVIAAILLAPYFHYVNVNTPAGSMSISCVFPFNIVISAGVESNNEKHTRSLFGVLLS